MQRINVVGSSASGKSTFSKRLAKKLNFPYIQMDQLYWEPNWREPPDETFFPRLEESLKSSTWVLDGNYSRTTEIKWKNVDTVIWLDFSFRRTLFQSLRRSASRAINRKELWPHTGNRESFRRSFFSKQSVIWWMITNYNKIRRRYKNIFSNPIYSHIKFMRFKSPKEAELFLASLQ